MQSSSQLFQRFRVTAIDVNWCQFAFGSVLLYFLYSLFFGPVYNPTVGPVVDVVTDDCRSYLLFKFVYFLLNTTLSVSAGCSPLSLDTILFTLIELTLLFCWPFLLAALSSTNWPSTGEMAMNKRENKQKSPPLQRELINMIQCRSVCLLFAIFFIDSPRCTARVSRTRATFLSRTLGECNFRLLTIHYFAIFFSTQLIVTFTHHKAVTTDVKQI